MKRFWMQLCWRRAVPLICSLMLVTLVVALSPPVQAEEVVELWRGGFNNPRFVAVNPTDGSCWVADTQNSQVVHLAQDGTQLWRGGGFNGPSSVSVNPTDGSCWVADSGNNQVVHLAGDGTQLWRGGGFDSPQSVCANPTDGSCWVADTYNNQVVHLAQDGTQVWRQGGIYYHPTSVSANPADGSCWVADTYNSQVVHLASDGTQLWRSAGYPTFRWPDSVSVNPTDGSCWVANAGQYNSGQYFWFDSAVVHLSESGTELWRGAAFNCPQSVSVNPTDGSCRVADTENNQVVHLAEDGTQLWRGGFNGPFCVSVNPTDGSCWVAAAQWYYFWFNSAVVHLSESGTELWRGAGFYQPDSVSVNPTDGSCWVADAGQYNSGQYFWFNSAVVHLSESGTELWRGAAFNCPQSVSVNPADGSCWVADSGNDEVVHLAEDGTQLWRGGGFNCPLSVSVNPTDGSCWVADTFNNQVVHLAQDGTQLWRSAPYPAFSDPCSVSVCPTDGSCWVADDYLNNQVVHLAQDGNQLWRGGENYSSSVSVNPADSSCWVASDQVVHLAQDGTQLWRSAGYPTFSDPYAVSVNRTDGSCWVADIDNNQVVHLVVVNFADVPLNHWAFHEVTACYYARIVQGYWNGYHPDEEVTRAQMAVYTSRALAQGDENVPSGPAVATFPDVPTDYWAYRYVEYAVDQGVVEGYGDSTYRPTLLVNRGAMAVYVARAMVAPAGDSAVPEPTEPPAPHFPDVNGASESWCYKHVEYCYDHGVVKGYEDGTYRPDVQVHRDQMAVYVQRAFHLPM